MSKSIEEKIINCQISLVANKDFSEEFRALLDVRKFVSDSFIVTDINEIRIGSIVRQIVDRLVEWRQLDDQVSDEAKSQLFVDRNSLHMVLANTMQGLYKSKTDGRLAYDHSWIVASCSLASLHKRQVAIARFPHPVNFGRQSQEVRFLVIVLAPSKEKLTKSAWETGRTFATMFTDINFRRRLLRAKSQEEIKAELLLRAELLARQNDQQMPIVTTIPATATATNTTTIAASEEETGGPNLPPSPAGKSQIMIIPNYICSNDRIPSICDLGAWTRGSSEYIISSSSSSSAANQQHLHQQSPKQQQQQQLWPHLWKSDHALRLGADLNSTIGTTLNHNNNSISSNYNHHHHHHHNNNTDDSLKQPLTSKKIQQQPPPPFKFINNLGEANQQRHASLACLPVASLSSDSGVGNDSSGVAASRSASTSFEDSLLAARQTKASTETTAPTTKRTTSTGWKPLKKHSTISTDSSNDERQNTNHRQLNHHKGKKQPPALQQQQQQQNHQTANCCTSYGNGLCDDIRRRLQYYLSDFTDGFMGENSLYKTISTTIFLYFSVLLPCIAFGVVDTNNTDGSIDPKKTLIGQALGGIFFALFSGQPLVVIMTTAPLCIYVKVIYQISQDLEIDFGSFYACVGLWMCLFLIIMSLTNSSSLMKYCTRSTEDIFALFTAFAFGSDGVKEAIRSFNKYYWEPECSSTHGLSTTHNTIISSSSSSSGSLTSHHSPSSSSSVLSQINTSPSSGIGGGGGGSSTTHQLVVRHLAAISDHLQNNNSHAPHEMSPLTQALTDHSSGASSSSSSSISELLHNTNSTNNINNLYDHLLPASTHHRCSRETCILFLFLMFGTLWLANSFSSFVRTPYLSSRKREIIKDYALAIAVLILSFIGSYLFSDVRLDVFEFGEFSGLHFVWQHSHSASVPQLLQGRVLVTGALLGFMLSILFYIDQNICGAMVHNAPFKLKKGDYFHLDLLVLAIINALLSLTGLPWMHGKLPHSHLHSKALADYEERVDEGHIHQIIVNIRETRLTGLLTSLLVALTLLAIPYPLSYIPLPVLSGVFLYTALAEFKSNSMIERVCLLFTEQAAYPPNHYIRRCPQRKIHYFTLAQLVQLAIVTLVGFYPNPYVNMAYPLVVATFVPVRELLLPRLIDAKYLHSLDKPSLD